MSEKRKDNPIFRKRLKMLLIEKNINQGELADELTKLLGKEEEEGISRRTVNFWCNGKAYPMEENLTALCDYFNVRKSWLFGESKHRTDREEMIANWDKESGITAKDTSSIQFIECLEDLSGKTLKFEDGESMNDFVSELVKIGISMAAEKGIEMEDRKITKRKRK